MRDYLAGFLDESSGAVSVDFVALTAAGVALALAAVLTVRSESIVLGDRIGDVVSAAIGDAE